MVQQWPTDRVWTEPFTQFAGLRAGGPLFGDLTGRLRRKKSKDAPLAAIIDRTRSTWPDARLCVLWDGDACLVSSRGLILADIQTERVTGAPIGAIERAVRYDQADPVRRVADLDPAAHARTSGFVAGLVGEIVGAPPGFVMGGAMVLDQVRRGGSEPVEWNHVEIRLRDPAAQMLKLTFCQNRAAAHEIEQMINAALK